MAAEPIDGQPDYLGAEMVRGTIINFLTVNKFRVRVFDGQEIDAVMAEELIPMVAEWYGGGPPLPPGWHISVEVRYRKLGMPLIISARPSALSG